MSDTTENKVKCPTCGSEKVHSSDNQFLWHPADPWNKEPITDDTPQFDCELYITFQCIEHKDPCDTFEIILDINVPKSK